jgi:GNAT superfamily N-acetyltransferase
MASVTIRDARSEDCERLTTLALESKAYWGYDDAFMEACREELTVRASDLDRGVIRVAERKGELVGFHGVVFAPQTELEWLFVLPTAIGSGVGRALLEDASTVARHHGALVLHIGSDPNAEAFYLARGAHRVGEIASASIPGRDLPLLELDVSSTA